MKLELRLEDEQGNLVRSGLWKDQAIEANYRALPWDEFSVLWLKPLLQTVFPQCPIKPKA